MLTQVVSHRRPPQRPGCGGLDGGGHTEHEAVRSPPSYQLEPIGHPVNPEHVFSCFFSFRRAFYHIFFNIIGAPKPIAELRSRVWESVVAHDFLGWMQGLHQRMKDFPTLITGPSGTGKERVAEAIGRSAYILFDPKKKSFEVDFLKAFMPVNLSALSPQPIESKLFATSRVRSPAPPRIGSGGWSSVRNRVPCSWTRSAN